MYRLRCDHAGVLKWKVPSNRDVTLSVPRRPPVSRVPCVTGRRTSVVAAIKFCRSDYRYLIRLHAT